MSKLVIGLLKCVAVWPLRLLYLAADFIYLIVYYVIGYRKRVVRRNLIEAFPEKSIREIKQIEKRYYHFMCDVIVETVKLLCISPDQLQRRVEISDPEVLNASLEQGKSVVLLLAHYGNWEWVQETGRYLTGNPFKASIYRPLNSKLWNEVYQQIRSRWELHIIPQKSAVRTLLDRANQPWVCGFIADARPRHAEDDARIPFLNHDTSFIYGPEVIGRKVGADFFFLQMERVKRGYYRITYYRLEPFDDGRPYPYTRRFWEEFEKVVREQPAFWLWSHKRWKYDRVLNSVEHPEKPPY